MDAKQAYKYVKWCNDNAILIYPIPYKSTGGSYHICVERKGVPTKGKVVFEDKPKRNENSIWDQIRELYKLIYEQENPN